VAIGLRGSAACLTEALQPVRPRFSEEPMTGRFIRAAFFACLIPGLQPAFGQGPGAKGAATGEQIDLAGATKDLIRECPGCKIYLDPKAIQYDMSKWQPTNTEEALIKANMRSIRHSCTLCALTLDDKDGDLAKRVPRELCPTCSAVDPVLSPSRAGDGGVTLLGGGRVRPMPDSRPLNLTLSSVEEISNILHASLLALLANRPSDLKAYRDAAPCKPELTSTECADATVRFRLSLLYQVATGKKL
jgi:hypothetical protein